MEKEQKTKYNKESIYKWREKNKDYYLSSISNYNYNRYNDMDPEKKQELINKIKLNIKERREIIKQNRPIECNIKRGRPRKHQIISNT